MKKSLMTLAIAITVTMSSECFAVLSPTAKMELEKEVAENSERIVFLTGLRQELLDRIPSDEDGANVLSKEIYRLARRQVEIVVELQVG